MRYPLVAAFLALCPAAFADTSVSIGFNAPGISIGFTRSSYPDLMLVPGMPVYYDPGFAGNYFFYDGQYWVYQGDEWYSSGWYDGPWGLVANYDVPLFLLRVPVQYYRRPPVYFRGWSGDAAPRWGERWGHEWEQRRHGWDRWDRAAAPRAAPLPTYQRSYSGNQYPRAPEQQHAIQSREFAAPRATPGRPERAGQQDRPTQRDWPVPQIRSPPQDRPSQQDRPAPQDRAQPKERPQHFDQQRAAQPRPEQQHADQQRAPQDTGHEPNRGQKDRSNGQEERGKTDRSQ